MHLYLGLEGKNVWFSDEFNLVLNDQRAGVLLLSYMNKYSYFLEKNASFLEKNTVYEGKMIINYAYWKNNRLFDKTRRKSW